MKVREIVYMVSDELKMVADDATFTNDHILFLVNKYRALILKKQYDDIKKHIPESNYQTICVNLTEDNSIINCCEGAIYLKSNEEIPYLLGIGSSKIYPINSYNSNITLVSKDRFPYVGNNKYLKNIMYSTIDSNNHLIVKSNNPQSKYLDKVIFTGLFQDLVTNPELLCNNDSTDDNCDPLDITFPLEDALVPMVIELVVKELSMALYRPMDIVNNAKDDFNNLAIANNRRKNNNEE